MQAIKKTFKAIFHPHIAIVALVTVLASSSLIYSLIRLPLWHHISIFSYVLSIYAISLVACAIPEIIVKILVMALGYSIILFIRDPFKLYIQDVLFDSTPKEEHQKLLTILEFGVKIATAGIGLGFSAILVGHPMVVIIAIMFAISIIEVILSVILYRAILIGKEQAVNQ
jgi:hypothetical protein